MHFIISILGYRRPQACRGGLGGVSKDEEQGTEVGSESPVYSLVVRVLQMSHISDSALGFDDNHARLCIHEAPLSQISAVTCAVTALAKPLRL